MWGNGLYTAAIEIITIYEIYSRDKAVGIEMGGGLDDRGLITGGDKRFFCSPQRTDWLGSPPSLSNGY
jgi:hypothetical protein